jgi:hypothetical protein
MDRIQIINKIISTLNFKRYLEIGVEDGECLRNVLCEEKVGVDPEPIEGVIGLTSDEFFAGYRGPAFDLIFIDGLHHSEQVISDIKNAFMNLSERGVVICHDCLPPSELLQRRPRPQRQWNGDVWKAIHHIRVSRGDLRLFTLDCDWGCTVIERGESKKYIGPCEEVDWEYFKRHGREFMNIVQPEYLDEFLNGRLP